MIEIVEGYDGSDERVNERVAKVVNEFRAFEFPSLYSSVSSSEVSEWFKDDGSNCLVYLGSKLVAIAFLYEVSSYTYLWFVPSPRAPSIEYVMNEILNWCFRERIRKGFKKPLRVAGSYECSFLNILLRKVLESYTVRKDATLMRLRKRISIERAPEGYEFSEVSPRDASDIARVYNEAFSSYPWFREVEPARFEERLRREGVVGFVARFNDSVVGFSLGRVYRALDGELSGYVSLLAVSKAHRGKGLGRYLLKKLVDEMIERGVAPTRIYLDSVEGLESYYRSMGFVDVSSYVSYILPYP